MVGALGVLSVATTCALLTVTSLIAGGFIGTDLSFVPSGGIPANCVSNQMRVQLQKNSSRPGYKGLTLAVTAVNISQVDVTVTQVITASSKLYFLAQTSWFPKRNLPDLLSVLLGPSIMPKLYTHGSLIY